MLLSYKMGNVSKVRGELIELFELIELIRMF